MPKKSKERIGRVEKEPRERSHSTSPVLVAAYPFVLITSRSKQEKEQVYTQEQKDRIIQSLLSDEMVVDVDVDIANCSPWSLTRIRWELDK